MRSGKSLVLVLAIALFTAITACESKREQARYKESSSAESLPLVPELKVGVCFKYPSSISPTYMKITERDEQTKSFKLEMYFGTGQVDNMKFVHMMGENKAREGVSLKESGIKIVDRCPNEGDDVGKFERKLGARVGKPSEPNGNWISRQPPFKEGRR